MKAFLKGGPLGGEVREVDVALPEMSFPCLIATSSEATYRRVRVNLMTGITGATYEYVEPQPAFHQLQRDYRAAIATLKNVRKYARGLEILGEHQAGSVNAHETSQDLLSILGEDVADA